MRAFLLSSSVAIAMVGCGPIGGVEKGDPLQTSSSAPPVMQPSDRLPTDVMQPDMPAPVAEGTAENSGAGCAVPSMAQFAALPTTESLPDPFLSVDGTRITTKAQWTCRRAEIAAQVQEYELGPKPSKPSIVTGAFADNVLTITAGEPDKTVDFTVTITRPAGAAEGPIPALITVGGNSLDASVFSERGIATIGLMNGAMGAQSGPGSRGTGTFYDLYGNGHGAGSMMAWAWGVSRIIDALETTPAAGIDTKHLAVTGCSRNGKGALVVGAFDERITLTIPQESGAGGSAAWRVSQVQEDAILARNPAEIIDNQVQTLSAAQGEQPWFRASFGQFNSAVTKLPFDHHMVLGLVAPRALFVVDNTSMNWLGNESSYTDSVAAAEIWTGLGKSGTMGASQVGGHNHCAFPASQRAELVAFVDKFLVGTETASTEILRSDGITPDRSRWIAWTTPALQ